jgi:hypothetical protein
MRIGTWNCRGVFARYGELAFTELAPDVFVVPEARPSDAMTGWQSFHRPYLDKGTGVFVRDGWTVTALDPPDGIERDWLLPLRIVPPAGRLGSFVLLAFWALGSRAPNPKMPKYTDQFAQVLANWGPVITNEPSVVAGDFNAWGQSPRHLMNLARAAELGLVSAYHQVERVESGSETDMTLRWVGPGRLVSRIHCDLVMVPAWWTSAIRSVSVGEWENWIHSGRSDHAPVIVELEDAALRA